MACVSEGEVVLSFERRPAPPKGWWPSHWSGGLRLQRGGAPKHSPAWKPYRAYTVPCPVARGRGGGPPLKLGTSRRRTDAQVYVCVHDYAGGEPRK